MSNGDLERNRNINAVHREAERYAKMRRDEHEDMRRQVEREDKRRNQPITRGEILDALDAAAVLTSTDPSASLALQALRRAFE